jgi:hypothetical protein
LVVEGMVSGLNCVIPNGITAPGNVEPDAAPGANAGVPFPVPMNGSTQRDASSPPRADAGSISASTRQQADFRTARLNRRAPETVSVDELSGRPARACWCRAFQSTHPTASAIARSTWGPTTEANKPGEATAEAGRFSDEPLLPDG